MLDEVHLHVDTRQLWSVGSLVMEPLKTIIVMSHL